MVSETHSIKRILKKYGVNASVKTLYNRHRERIGKEIHAWNTITDSTAQKLAREGFFLQKLGKNDYIFINRSPHPVFWRGHGKIRDTSALFRRRQK